MQWLSLIIAIVALIVGVVALARTRRVRPTAATSPPMVVPAPAPLATPWKLSIAGNRFGFRNVSTEALDEVRLQQTNGDVLTAEQPMPVPRVAPGGEIAFVAHWKHSSPPTAQVRITWRSAAGGQLHFDATLV